MMEYEYTPLERYAIDLAYADIHDDDLFCQSLCHGMALLDLSELDVANEFGVNRSTVLRWRTGVNLPHVFIRRPIYVWLAGTAYARLHKMEKEER